MRGCTKPPGILWVLAVHCSSEGDMLRAKHTQRAARSLHGNHWGNRCALKKKTHWLQAAVFWVQIKHQGTSNRQFTQSRRQTSSWFIRILFQWIATYVCIVCCFHHFHLSPLCKLCLKGEYPNIAIISPSYSQREIMLLVIISQYYHQYYHHIPIFYWWNITLISLYPIHIPHSDMVLWFPLKSTSKENPSKFIIWSYLKIGYPKKTTHGFEHV